MPAPAICPQCHSSLPVAPGSGVCPLCGSKLAGETPPAEATVPTGVSVPVRDPLTAPTASPAAGSVVIDGSISSQPAAPPILIGYDQLTPLGSGGMGVVYRAVQSRTGRATAIKFLHITGNLNPDLRSRFSNEALALARIRHPHVVEILEVGVAEDRPFIAMEYAPGETLAERLRSDPPTPRQAAQLVAKVAAGIEAVHRADVLHRDLKPSNVLLTPDDMPKVSDFGLARLCDRDDGVTYTGQALGTPSYMAPEQANGWHKAIDKRTDVFGLGAILYESLCGRPPFKARSHTASLRLAAACEVKPPGAVRADVPAELEAVCLKCLEKDPAQRFQTAQELADELDLWLNGKPTDTRPLTRLQKVGRAVRRHRLKLAAVGMVFLAVVGGLLGAWYSNPRRQIERALARNEEVVLIPEKGPPKWSEWRGGKVATDVSPGEGAFGYQTLSLDLEASGLILVRDPQTDTYRLTADIKHSIAHTDSTGVGLFLGLEEILGPNNMQIKRWVEIRYSDFYANAELMEPAVMARHGLIADDMLSIRLPGQANHDGGSSGYGKQYPFQAAQRADVGWRTIIADVSPDGIRVSWNAAPTDPTSKTVFAFFLSAERISSHIDTHNRSHGPVYHGFVLPQLQWNPRRPMGVFARSAAVSFRNVVITPAVKVQPEDSP